MEQITILGNIGKAEKKNLNDKEFIEFSVACNFKKKDGSTTTTWYRVNTNQTNLLPYLEKGQKIYVQGKPLYQAYIDKEGNPVASVTIFADRTELCGKRESDGQQPQPKQQYPQQQYSPKQQQAIGTLNQQFGAVPVQPQQQSLDGFQPDDLPF